MSWINRFDTSAPSNLDFRVMRPATSLQSFVRYYWTLKCHGDHVSTDEYLAPDGFEEVIFNFGGRYRRTQIQGDSTSRVVLDRSYVVGCKTTGVNCLRLTNLSMVGIKLWPGTLYSLLGVPLHRLSGCPVLLGDLGLPKLYELESRLHDARSDHEIKELLDQSLESRDISRHWNALVSRSVMNIFGARGDIGVDTLLRPFGCHYRTAERAFQERVGVSPKQLAKVIRFKHAFMTLNRSAIGARKAMGPLDCGYYDASHFTKDFRWFTGTNPTNFFHSAISTEIYHFCLDVDLRQLKTHEIENTFLL